MELIKENLKISLKKWIDSLDHEKLVDLSNEIILEVLRFSKSITALQNVKSLNCLRSIEYKPSPSLPDEIFKAFSISWSTELFYIKNTILPKEEKNEKLVYAMEFDNGLIKIGRTKTRDRHKGVSSCNAGKLIRVEYIPVSDFKVEKIVHKKLSEEKSHGEYFKLTFEKAVSMIMMANSFLIKK